MVFSSISFLFYFLPLIILLYFIVPLKLRNITLLIGSLFFYFYGEPKYILVLIFSIVFNYYIGRIISNNNKYNKLIFVSSLVINFGILFYFKYFDFFIDNINRMFTTNFNYR